MANMKLIVFNVEQGQCVYIRTPSDYGILIDCGKGSSGPTPSPAEWLAENEIPSLKKYQDHPIAAMIVTQPDDGYVADIAMVIQRLSPAALFRDVDFDWPALTESKQNLQAYYKWQSGFELNPQPTPELGVSIKMFSLNQLEAEQLGGDTQQTINNRSKVTVVTYNSPEEYTWKVVIAGDNNTNGWEALLAKPEFRTEIAEADFFIVSNHGQESGFSADVFEAIGKPIANIISTVSGIERADNRYRKLGQGVKFPDGTRTHFVTREDGNITVQMNDDGKYDVWLYTP